MVCDMSEEMPEDLQSITDAAADAIASHPDVCAPGRAIIIYGAHGRNGVTTTGFTNDEEIIELLLQTAKYISETGDSGIGIQVMDISSANRGMN
jgi:hypothetical protein